MITGEQISFLNNMVNKDILEIRKKKNYPLPLSAIGGAV
jgi:hypothetical protein